VIACAVPAAASAASAPPVLQRFQIALGAGAASATASGAVVNGAGTATPTSPTSFSLSFPTGPGFLTETVQHTVGGLGPGCVELLSQSGTFTFSYDPDAEPEVQFGGIGTFTSNSLTVYQQAAGGGCDTTAAPLVRLGMVNAGATQLFVAI
jgi:hypothetical protein